MEIGRALTYYTKDPKFVNVVAIFSLLLLSCIFVLPIFFVGPLFVGYTVAVVRRIQNGDYTLPEIEYNQMWMKGLMLVLIQIAISIAFSVVMFAIALPLQIIFGLNAAPSSSRTVGSYRTAQQLTALQLVISAVIQLIQFVFNVIMALLSVMMLAIYAKTNEVNSLVRFDNYKKLWTNNGLNIIIVTVLSGIVGGLLTFVGFLLCCIGILPMAVISGLINAGLVGQLKTQEIA